MADIHGNLQALEAVLRDVGRASPDRLIVAGDLINRFVQPREVLERLNEVDHVALHGNADLYAATCGMSGWRVDWPPMREIARWNRLAIGDEWARYLRELPDYVTLSVASPDDVLISHAIPGDPFHGITSEYREGRWQAFGWLPYGLADPEEVRSVLTSASARLFLTAHTHVAFVREMYGVTVANPGAVMYGHTVRNGERLAEYLICTWEERRREWRLDFRQVPYDVEATRRSLRAMVGRIPCVEQVLEALRPERAAWREPEARGAPPPAGRDHAPDDTYEGD